jgi:hypothetical protein
MKNCQKGKFNLKIFEEIPDILLGFYAAYFSFMAKTISMKS